MKVYYVYVNKKFMHEFTTYTLALDYVRKWFKTNPRDRYDSITISELEKFFPD